MSFEPPINRTMDFITEQVHYVYRNSFTAIGVNFAVSLILASIIWSDVPNSTLLSWLGVILFLTLCRLSLGFFFLRQDLAQIERHALRWLSLYATFSTLTGFCWGMTVWLFDPADNLSLLSYFLIILAGLIAGAAAVQGVSVVSFIMYVLAVGLPVVTWMLSQATGVFMSLSVVMLIYMASMIATGLVYKRVLLQSFNLAKELEHAKDLAEASNYAKSQFLSNMSHEIRTPLNSVIGMTHLMMETPLNSTQADYIERINHSSSHLLGIVSDILDFSKIEAGKLEFEEKEFSIKQLLDKLVRQLEYAAKAKQLSLKTELNLNVPLDVVGDPLRVEQILLNYANNAIKFTHSGQITISVNNAGFEDGIFTLRFDVEDTGIGMEEEQIHHLFKLFHQGDTSITRKYGGTGLGLAICKQLAELMGGEVGVESEKGAGSRFWFTVKLQSSNRDRRIEKDDEQENLKGAKILLVEDNEVNQVVAKALLEKMHARITIAENGQEAIERLGQEEFDCVLMDVQMPVMDGYRATRIIRENPNLKHNKIIALTANAGKEDQERCFDVGMDAVVTKPFKPPLLFQAIQDVIGHSSPIE